jgi:hypothetical protein
MSSFDKRKHKTLTLSARAEIIKKLRLKLMNFAKEYGVGRATMYDIRKNTKKIECFVKNTCSGPSDRQSLNTELMDKYSQYDLCM